MLDVGSPLQSDLIAIFRQPRDIDIDNLLLLADWLLVVFQGIVTCKGRGQKCLFLAAVDSLIWDWDGILLFVVILRSPFLLLRGVTMVIKTRL